jgi:threonine dehydrogenase-like Zn-dependent dehydrogenase
MSQPIRIFQARLYGAGDLRIEDSLFDTGSLQAGEVFVRTQFTALSTGTDLGNFEGRSKEVPGAPDYPRSVGYSNAGVVAAAGPAATWQPGDRVFSLQPHCSGFRAAAGDLLVRIPEGVDMEQASLAYLVHLGVASMRQVGYEAGERVCVVGLGVIGLSTVAAARAMGARVIAVGKDEGRTCLARQLGAGETYVTGTLDPASAFGGQGADIVVLTANSWSAWEESMQVARFGGRVTVLGFPGRNQPTPPFNPLRAEWLYAKQLTIQGAGRTSRIDCSPADIRFNLSRSLQYVLDLMASGDLDLSPVISHRLPFLRMREAYELAARHAPELTAAAFDWREAPDS